MVLLLFLACASQAPVPLPPKVEVPPAVDARRVKVPGVEGYIARPAQGAPTRAVLLLVDRLDEDSAVLGRAEAERGSITLEVPPEVDTARARAYLSAMPGVTEVRTRCLREDCPESTP